MANEGVDESSDMQKLNIKFIDLLMTDLDNDTKIMHSNSIETNENNKKIWWWSQKHWIELN